MNPGGAALIAFFCVPLVTAVSCVALLHCARVPLLRPPGASKRVSGLRVFGVTTFCTALVFWVWAVYNSVHSFDLGAVSFVFPIVSSGLLLASRGPSIKRLQQQRWMVALAPLLPALNFFLGVSIVMGTETKLLLAYFIIGGVGWMLNGVLGFMLVSAVLTEAASNQAVILEA